ncbi:gfo/Idh/MocA family oxidoreductase, partial [bacterium]|nr:gfo/Idh/MocA family oxidoreductase [bacterium]
GSGIDVHPKSLLDVEIEPETASLFRSERHDQNFIDAVRARKRAVTTVAQAVRSDIISQMSNIAIRLGRKIVWDPKKEEIVGDPEAEKMLHRDLRGSWTL